MCLGFNAEVPDSTGHSAHGFSDSDDGRGASGPPSSTGSDETMSLESAQPYAQFLGAGRCEGVELSLGVGRHVELLTKIPYAPTRGEAERQRDGFARRYRRSYPNAVTILEKDWERMVAFYDFPVEHWKHLRTTNVVESPFAAVRLRTDAAKRFKKAESASAMIWKLLMVAESRFRRLDAPEHLADVYAGAEFVDGKAVIKD
jgi:hypothetical protein